MLTWFLPDFYAFQIFDIPGFYIRYNKSACEDWTNILNFKGFRADTRYVFFKKESDDPRPGSCEGKGTQGR